MDNIIFVIETSDERFLYLMDYLLRKGHIAVPMGEEKDIKGLKKVYIFNLGSFLSDEIIENLENGSIVFARSCNYQSMNDLQKKDITFYNYFDDEIFMMKNAYITAEGTLSYIINNTKSSLENMKILVFGFGRVGKSLIKVLKNNNANVSVALRNPEKNSFASIIADKVFDLEEYKEKLYTFDVIVNTIPKIILKGDEFKLIRKDCFIIDLASKPGGLDYESAKIMDMKVIHALGVPGKMMPKTAAIYLQESILKRLEN